VKVWLFAAVLVLWGNLLHPLIGGSAVLPGGSWQFVAAGAVLVAFSLVGARALGASTEPRSGCGVTAQSAGSRSGRPWER